MKISKDIVNQIERHIIKLVGKSKLSEKERLEYESPSRYARGMSTTERYYYNKIEEKIKSLSNISFGSLWRNTKGDYIKVMDFAKIHKAEKVIEVLENIVKNKMGC